MLLSDKNKRIALIAICADLLFSIVFLAYAANAYFKTANGKTTDISFVAEQTAKESVATPNEEESADASPQKELADNEKKIASKKKNIKDEMAHQKETYKEDVNREDGWCSLEELKAISPEAYEDCMRQLDYERKESAEALEARKLAMNKLDQNADLLSEAELKELKETLEFLNTCDDCKVRQVPMPDRSEDYDDARIQNLQRIARKFCCGQIGCPEEAIEMHDRKSRISDGGSYYLPILPSNVHTLQHQ